MIEKVMIAVLILVVSVYRKKLAMYSEYEDNRLEYMMEHFGRVIRDRELTTKRYGKIGEPDHCMNCGGTVPDENEEDYAFCPH